jgi:polysaccharide transporter, PST family
MTSQRINAKEKKIILENFVSLSTLQGINYILPVIVLFYLIRIIGPEKFGLLAFAQALTQYFVILTDYGFSVSATREISLCRDEQHKVCRIVSSVMAVKFVLIAISLAILGLLLVFVPKLKADWLVYLFSFGAVVGNVLFPLWFFQGIEKMKYIAVLNIISGVICAFAILLFVRKPGDYLSVPLIYSLTSLVTGGLGLYIVANTFGVKLGLPDPQEVRRQLRGGWNLFTSIVAINAYTNTRIFAVGLLTNNVLTGYYSIAERIANTVQTFPVASFSQALYPRLSKIFQKNKKRAMRIMSRVQLVTTAVYCLVLPIIFWLAPWLIQLVCGAEYQEASLALRLLLLSVLFVVANAFKIQFLLVCGRSDIYSIMHVGVALLGLPLIFLAIMSYSYIGAAFATIMIEGVMFLLTFRVMRYTA